MPAAQRQWVLMAPSLVTLSVALMGKDWGPTWKNSGPRPPKSSVIMALTCGFAL
jgi:hypothetical protein